MPKPTATPGSIKRPAASQAGLADSGPAVQEPTDMMDLIRTRAYQLYELRGRGDGLAQEDWLQAETEVVASQPRKAAA